MNLFFQCACLFLSLLYPQTSLVEESKQLFDQIRWYEQEEKTLRFCMDKIEDKMDSNAHRLLFLEQEKEKGKLLLIGWQNGIEMLSSKDEMDFAQLNQELKTIENHQQLLATKQSELKNRLDQTLDQLEQLKVKRDTFLLDHIEWSGMKEEGSFQEEALLSGLYDLPSIGSPLEEEENGISCLEGIENATIHASTFFGSPFESYTISAGTWEYPNGGKHLGMDFAVPMYSKLLAPIDGLILYADAPCSDNDGYLGNYEGWPAGGGNSIGMLGQVGDQLYFLSFCHLSSSIYVRAGQSVEQGDVLALSGNSGNSTGPHCHIEVFSLSKDLEDVLFYFMETADFTWQNGWSSPGTCSEYGCRIRPETVF